MPERYFTAQPSGAEIEGKIAGPGAWFEVDLDALSANLAAIRERTGVEVMPVVKNNAYGHGLRPICSALVGEGVEWLTYLPRHKPSLSLSIFRGFCPSKHRQRPRGRG
jgi:hypothetical protein